MFARGPDRSTPPGTLLEIFFRGIERYQRPDAMQFRRDGRWHQISHATIRQRVQHIAQGLQTLGVVRGDRVALLSENRPEWALCDYACLSLGVADVPIYSTLPAEQIPYLLTDSGAVALWVSNAAQAEKVASIRSQAPGLKYVIGFDEETRPWVDLLLADVETRGREHDSTQASAAWETTARAVRPDDLATIIYTSGTTGAPKGVMLSHDNIYSNVIGARSSIASTREDVALSFLPLSHIFERMGDYWYFETGVSVAYAETFDLVPIAMAEVRPTLVMSVPRLYEKMYARVLENALSGGALKRQIFFWAKGVGERFLAAREAGHASPWLAMQYALAHRLVFSKLQQRTGGRLRYFISGGAPLAPEINRFFNAAGLIILEGYGLTETSPVISNNTPAASRIGTVGRPAEGVELMIAADGEILTRGPHVMQGYFNKPEATREAIDEQGWFHTGDIGVIEDGYLRITDRKKDLIVTAGGKNIAPQPIENLVKTNKYVSQVVMLGDRRKFPVMLVVPNFEQLERWAKIKELIWTDRAQLLQMPTVQAKMEKEVRGKLGGLASFETPKKLALLEHDFTIESGELTPTLKVKRRVIDQKYKAVIDALYAGGPPGDDR